jgi:hypothetical protein
MERLHNGLKNIVELCCVRSMETWPFGGVRIFILGAFDQKSLFSLLFTGIFDVFDVTQISTSCSNIFNNFDSVFPNIYA